MAWSYSLCLLALQFLRISSVREYELIQDYFTYKNVNRVVGFSCYGIESDFTLAKMLNEEYKYSTFWNSISITKKDFRNLLNAPYYQLGVFLDLKCNNQSYARIISQATKYSMYDEMHKWLILGRNLSHTLQALNDKAFSIMTDVVIAVPSGNGYILYDVYNPCKDRNGQMNVTVYGTWYDKEKLNVTLTMPKLERRSNLHGMKIKVGIAISYRPENITLHEMLLSNTMKAKYGRTKFLYQLLLYMADLFNFTIEIVEISTQRRFDNSGPVFIAFQKKLIDVSASPVTMKIDRLNNGDIIGAVWPMRSCFMFRTISSTKMNIVQFLKPLSVKVWYVILGLIGITIIILILVLRLENIPSPTESYGISVLLAIGALTQQGSTFVPRHYAGRIAFLQILLFGLLILHYYSASVVSDRLKNTGERMNDSLISLADSNLKIAVEPTTYIRSFLQVPDPEVRYFYEKRWLKLPETSRYLPLEEGLNRVAAGTLAYHSMIDTAYPYIEHSFQDRSICELTEVHLFRTTLAMFARYKSPFTKLMKIGLTKMNTVGIRDRGVKKWSARKPYCPNNLLIAEPLSIHEAAPVFIFLCICAGISLLICVIENLLHYIWPARIDSSSSQRQQFITTNINFPSLLDMNWQSLKNLNFFKDLSSS